jgi:hypothetical protein
VPGAVRVILFYDAGLLFDDFGLGTRAGHGRAEEHVDDEHNQEEDAESDAQIEQPKRLNTRTSCHCHYKRDKRSQDKHTFIFFFF